MFLNSEERQETILACRHCMMCHVADRVTSLVRRESYTPRGRGAILFALEQGLIKPDKAVADIMYTTLNDGLLLEWCLGNYDQEELIIDARARLFKQGLAPDSVVDFIKTVKKTKDKGSNPNEVLSRAGVDTEKGAEMLLFCGCASLESGNDTIVSLGHILTNAQKKFQILENEPCCGWPLYQLGDWEGAKTFSTQVSDSIRETGASTVVVLDADCYRMLTTRTARFGGDLEGIKIIHVNELLAGMLDEDNLPISKPLSEPITYHDPCALARYCHDTESPRKILKSITTGTFKEMETNKKLANCCGQGGMLQVHRPDIADRVASLRLEDARETGAEILAAGCSRCVAMLSNVQTDNPERYPRIVNIVDLLASAMGL